MNNRLDQEHVPAIRPAIHPGEILQDELDFLDMRAAELARALDVPVNRVPDFGGQTSDLG